MLSSGIFPSRLKFSEIKTHFKKGDKSNVSNYRPYRSLHPFQQFFKDYVY